jgi:hypothetical protein
VVDGYIGNNFEGYGLGRIEVLSRHWPGGTEEKSSAMIACVPAEIRTEYLPNTSLEHYLYLELL